MDAEKIAEAVLFYVFRIAFIALIFIIIPKANRNTELSLHKGDLGNAI